MTEIMQIEINSVYYNEQLTSLEKVSNTLDLLEINLARWIMTAVNKC